MTGQAKGSAQGWSVVGHPGAWQWTAFVGGNSESGDCSHRADAEGRAKRAHRRLMDDARRQTVKVTE